MTRTRSRFPRGERAGSSGRRSFIHTKKRSLPAGLRPPKKSATAKSWYNFAFCVGLACKFRSHTGSMLPHLQVCRLDSRDFRRSACFQQAKSAAFRLRFLQTLFMTSASACPDRDGGRSPACGRCDGAWACAAAHPERCFPEQARPPRSARRASRGSACPFRRY